MSQAITALDVFESFQETGRDIFEVITHHNFIDDENEEYENISKEMTRVLELKEDLKIGGRSCNSNSTSNNHSFIEIDIDSQIWDCKDDRRDDSIVFVKNFEKIKKIKKNKHKKIKKIFNKNNKINKNNCNNITNGNNKDGKIVFNFQNYVEESTFNYKYAKNYENFNYSPTSTTPTCWSNEMVIENDRVGSKKFNTTSNIYARNSNAYKCDETTFSNKYFSKNRNDTFMNQSPSTEYFSTQPSQSLYHTKNIYQSNQSKNPFESLQNDNIRGKGHLDGEANRINRENILRGKDKRTTLMIRHIPNKYNLHTMIEDFNLDFKGKFDVFYLPIDYINNCNLGFAFINFVDSMHILQFYETFRGKKWRRFNSEKICELAYAKFQGKKELIQHFEKGSIMNFESEEKKPLILPTPDPLPAIEIPLVYIY